MPTAVCVGISSTVYVFGPWLIYASVTCNWIESIPSVRTESKWKKTNRTGGRQYFLLSFAWHFLVSFSPFGHFNPGQPSLYPRSIVGTGATGPTYDIGRDLAKKFVTICAIGATYQTSERRQWYLKYDTNGQGKVRFAHPPPQLRFLGTQDDRLCNIHEDMSV